MCAIEIRPLTEVQHIDQLEDVQRGTWGMEEVELIPNRLMHALQLQGAALLGAIDHLPDGREKVVGFVFGVLGTMEGLSHRIDQVAAARLKMYSAIMGVLPEYQSQGIGRRLKLSQRDFALRIGVRLITWTYDPLESRNALLNINKLGVVCQEYWRNFHGEMGGINAGTASDRFHVEWWVTSNRVKARVDRGRKSLSLSALIGGGAQLINETSFDARGLPAPPANLGEPTSNLLLVEIPYDIQRVKEADTALAQRWRSHTRELFERLFERGFLATDFVTHRDSSGYQRSYYLLTLQDS